MDWVSDISVVVTKPFWGDENHLGIVIRKGHVKYTPLLFSHLPFPILTLCLIICILCVVNSLDAHDCGYGDK